MRLLPFWFFNMEPFFVFLIFNIYDDKKKLLGGILGRRKRFWCQIGDLPNFRGGIWSPKIDFGSLTFDLRVTNEMYWMRSFCPSELGDTQLSHKLMISGGFFDFWESVPYWKITRSKEIPCIFSVKRSQFWPVFEGFSNVTCLIHQLQCCNTLSLTDIVKNRMSYGLRGSRCCNFVVNWAGRWLLQPVFL